MTDQNNKSETENQPQDASDSLRERVRIVLQTLDKTQEQAAGEIGLSKQAFGQWLNDKYKANPRRVEKKVRAWLTEREPTSPASETDPTSPVQLPEDLPVLVKRMMNRYSVSDSRLALTISVKEDRLKKWLKGDRDDLALGQRLDIWTKSVSRIEGAEQYIETQTAEKVQSMIAYAQMSGELVAIYGFPGVGKTMAIRAFHQMFKSRSWWATISPASAALVSSLQKVAASMGLGHVSGGALALSEAISSHLEDHPGGVIIIDEAQHLTPSAVEQLRAIHDATGVGLVLCGNEQGYARLTGARKAAFAQIYSRIGAVLYVGLPTETDVFMICDTLGVDDIEARTMLIKEAAKPGGLRAVVKPVRMVLRAGKHVTAKNLRNAIRNLGGEAES